MIWHRLPLTYLGYVSGCWIVCARKYFATTPTTAGFARGGCGLFRRREYSYRVYVAFLRRVGELA